jgi:O-antigen/teichoic acid export membrane protein
VTPANIEDHQPATSPPDTRSYRSGFLALADQLIASATNFLTGAIIGRACAPEEFGLYLLGFSIVLFIMRPQGALVSTPYMVIRPRLTRQDAGRYTGSTLCLNLLISVIASAVLAGTAAILYLLEIYPDLVSVLWALSVSIVFILLREFVRQHCFARLNFEKAVIIDISVAAVQLSALVILFSLEFLSASNAFLIIGVATGFGSAIWLVSTWHSIKIKAASIISDLKTNWTIGKWIFSSACSRPNNF